MPRPPPPNAALTSTGKPIRAASATESRSSSARPCTPGSVGTPAAAISALASIFEPMAAIASGDGPTNVSPAAAQSRAKPGVLREEPVAGVDGVGAGRAGGGDDQVAAQVRVGGSGAGQADGLVGERDEREVGVGVGEHGDGGDAELVGGAEDAGGDLRRGWPPAAC